MDSGSRDCGAGRHYPSFVEEPDLQKNVRRHSATDSRYSACTHWDGHGAILIDFEYFDGVWRAAA